MGDRHDASRANDALTWTDDTVLHHGAQLDRRAPAIFLLSLVR